jgi:HEAT repeat protein
MRVEIGAAIPLLVERLADFNSETRTAAASVLAELSENGALHLGFTV